MMSRYAMEFVDKNRGRIENDHPTEDDFVANYLVSDMEIENFKTWAEGQGTEESPIEISDEDWAVSGKSIILRLKAFIGRNVYEQSTFYRIIGGLNESLQEAVKILKDGTFKKSNLAHKSFK
jgi:carboxyl-terminal processing protease